LWKIVNEYYEKVIVVAKYQISFVTSFGLISISRNMVIKIYSGGKIKYSNIKTQEKY
jgi:hypothetical protein